LKEEDEYEKRGGKKDEVNMGYKKEVYTCRYKKWCAKFWRM